MPHLDEQNRYTEHHERERFRKQRIIIMFWIVVGIGILAVLCWSLLSIFNN